MKGGIVRALQLDIAQAEAKLKVMSEGFRNLREFLHSPKFTGQEADGSRKDWIATGDVLSWLSAIEGDVNAAGDELKGCPKCGRVMTAGTFCPCELAEVLRS